MGHEERTTQWKQWAASIIATITLFCYGTSIGWITTVLPRLLNVDSPIPMTPDQSSWMVSFVPLGCLLGALLAALCSDNFGRKNTLIFTSLTSTSGWMLTLFATGKTELYLARAILGIGGGLAGAVCPVYISEIADVSIGGAIGTISSLNIIAGMTFACVIGPFVSTQNLTIILLSFPILFLLCFAWFPETPCYLAIKGRHEEAARSLAFFRGIGSLERANEDLRLVIKNINQDMELLSWREKLHALLLPNNRKAIALQIYLNLAQSSCGCSTLQAYLSVILRSAEISMDPDFATTTVLVVSLFSCGAGTALIERIGRKPLLLISSSGISGVMLVLGTYLLLVEQGLELQVLNWIPVLVIVLSQVFYQVGLSMLPNVLVGELFPTNVKGIASTLAIIVYAVSLFVVSKMYQVVDDAVGGWVNFYIFAGLSLISFVVFLVFFPETRNRTVKEIQEEIAGKRRGGFDLREISTRR